MTAEKQSRETGVGTCTQVPVSILIQGAQSSFLANKAPLIFDMRGVIIDFS